MSLNNHYDIMALDALPTLKTMCLPIEIDYRVPIELVFKWILAD